VDMSSVEAPPGAVKLLEYFKSHAGKELTKNEVCDGAGVGRATFDRHLTWLKSQRVKCVNEDAPTTTTRLYVCEAGEASDSA
jgi:hypothetical protein